MRRLVALLGIVAALSLSLSIPVWADDDGIGIAIGAGNNGGEDNSDGSGSIDTSVGVGSNESPGDDGTPVSDSGSTDESSTSGGGDGTSPPDLCGKPMLVDPPPAGDPQWSGSDPETHDMYVIVCWKVIIGGGGSFPETTIVITDKGEPPALPPPDPGDLAEQVWDHMRTTIPAPQPTTSPDFRTAINDTLGVPTTWVNLWNWMWAGDDVWAPVTDTLTVRGVSVTVTAEPVGLRLDPGTGDPEATCANPPGIPYFPPADNVADPSRDPAGLGGCGWKYTHATSLSHLIQARLMIDWDASWASNVGRSGDLGSLTTFRDTEPFVVAERRVVIVPNGG